MKIQVIGVYTVEKEPDVHLFELVIQEKASLIDVGAFTQEDRSKPRDSWQTAYDEYYLNSAGDHIIGDYFSLPEKDDAPTRLTFFMYYFDFGIPLQSQFGEITVPGPSPVPERLRRIIAFEPAD